MGHGISCCLNSRVGSSQSVVGAGTGQQCMERGQDSMVPGCPDGHSNACISLGNPCCYAKRERLPKGCRMDLLNVLAGDSA
eukprot:2617269-Alexandrium_andersonii.AAC.1